MESITLTEDQKTKARALNEGAILIAYRDGSVLRMETAKGVDPYVWRENQWRAMEVTQER